MGRLAPDTVIFRPDPRLRSTDAEQGWPMLVVTMDIVDGTDHDHAGKWRRALEIWVPEQPPAALCDGDIIVQLTHQGEPADPLRRDHAVDVEMLLCSVLYHHVVFIAADAFAT